MSATAKGVLTEAVRRRPYSVVLLDEIEKAHQDVMELFYSVFDKGTLEDSEGREVDFKNTVILLTSNAGTDTFMKLCADPETMPTPTALAEAIRPDLLKVFKPAFLGRMTIVPYYPLGDDVMKSIIRLQLGRIGKRLKENHRAEFVVDDGVVDAIRNRCREVESALATSITSSPARCCRRSPASSCPAWPQVKPSAASECRSTEKASLRTRSCNSAVPQSA